MNALLLLRQAGEYYIFPPFFFFFLPVSRVGLFVVVRPRDSFFGSRARKKDHRDKKKIQGRKKNSQGYFFCPRYTGMEDWDPGLAYGDLGGIKLR